MVRTFPWRGRGGQRSTVQLRSRSRHPSILVESSGSRVPVRSTTQLFVSALGKRHAEEGRPAARVTGPVRRSFQAGDWRGLWCRPTRQSPWRALRAVTLRLGRVAAESGNQRGQNHPESTAFSHLAMDLDTAAVRLHHALGQRQSQPDAAVWRARLRSPRKKGMIPARGLAPEYRSVIDHLDGHRGPVGRAPRHQLDGCRRSENLAAFSRRLSRTRLSSAGSASTTGSSPSSRCSRVRSGNRF